MNELALKYDEKLVAMSTDYLAKEAQILEELGEMHKQRLFTPLGYSNIFDYCERRLKLSSAQAFYFKTIFEKSQEVPEIGQAVRSGELSVSQARRIAPAVTKANCRAWIEKAKDLKQRDLEREVKAVNPKAHVKERIRPVAKDLAELKCPVDPKTEANLKALTDLLSQKRKKSVALAEVIAWMAEEMTEKHDPLKKAARGKTISSRNPPKSGRHPVPTSVVHPVQLRDGNQCTFVGPFGVRCEQKRWLHLHHVKEVAKGGLNSLDNLRILCQAHHRLTHAQGRRTAG